VKVLNPKTDKLGYAIVEKNIDSDDPIWRLAAALIGRVNGWL